LALEDGNRSGERDALLNREKELLEQHQRSWLGFLAPGLEDWNVERSPFLLSIEKRGEKRGRDEMRNMLREKLVHLVGSHFPGGIPDEVVKAVNAQTDAGTLADWLAQVPLARTHDDIRATLGLG
jgi:hypothetical protein